jgi:hypothetical protein
VGVVVTVFEAHFVGMYVGVRVVTMRMLVDDVLVLMLVVGMVVDLRIMRVLMIVGCGVFVCCVHILSFLASLFGIASSSDQARHKTDQRGPLPSLVT